MNQSSFV
jgi:hypothetical protein